MRSESGDDSSERSGFYTRVLQRLLDEGVLDRSMSVLVLAGEDADQRAFEGLRLEDVTITNLDAEQSGEPPGPRGWTFQDAESLTYPDGSFDFAVVSAGLHHCRSPHRALLEMYRVARRGLVAIESRDSFLMRAAVRLGAADEYELTAVVAHGFESGGVRNSPVPNFVYRWTEREVRKTIASYAPHAKHRIIFLRELELPLSVIDLRSNRLWGVGLRALLPLVSLLARLFPSQCNLFAFVVLKPELPRDLQPWLVLRDGRVAPDEPWLRSRFSVPERAAGR